MPRWTTRDLGTDPAGAERFFEVAARAAIARRKRKPGWIYRTDPVAWLHDMVRFEEGEAPTEYQEELLAAIATHGRASGRGPHGLGKTTIGGHAPYPGPLPHRAASGVTGRRRRSPKQAR